jgi:outer membrane protein assembly factor BamB
MNGPSQARVTAALFIPALVWVFGLFPADKVTSAPQAQAVLGQLESNRGICAVLEDREAELAIELARTTDLTLYVQMADGANVQAARLSADAAGLLNRRVYVEQGTGRRIHLADNLVDAVVVCDDSRADVAEEEILRILRPGGKGLMGSKVIVKPFPEGVDDWSHPYHGPDNNPQSKDLVARAPYLTQFLAEPWYCPMPEVTVASGGRVFKAFGSRAFRRPQWPMLNKLIALNGYNGTMLWQRDLDPDFMIHRNTMIATPETLYLADAVSCKLLDAVTGEIKDEIVVPPDLSDGPVWKWMAMIDGTLYALVGEKEPPGDALKGPAFRGAGWPWWEISNYAWGFGRTILAIDPAKKEILWHHREDYPLDTRAMCMTAGRIYYYSPGKLLGCLDAKTGDAVWKTSESKAIEAIADQRPAQRAVWGFASTAFAKCSDRAIYFAGPKQNKLVAASAGDGNLLWQFAEDGNFQLVLRDEGLYAMGSNQRSRKFDPLTGETLLQLPNRAACTRATGTVDRVFVRGRGTRCWDVAADKWLHISPMRPACHDGVVIAGGNLYWGPWMCGCNLSLIGVICLSPAGDFDHSMQATEAERLEVLSDDADKIAPLAQTKDDWPTYRRDNTRSTRSELTAAAEASVQWEYKPDAPHTSTAPVAVGDLVFVAGSDGVVRALGASDGKPQWTAYTGGAIRIPPTIADGRALVGSADGWVYAMEASTGRPLWRFRAAPLRRKIAVYGSLSSTWPVSTGVLVEDGAAYAACGIANYDGTHVYSLDAATGQIRWQNNTSGKTDGGQGAGASVHGDLLLHGGKLYMAGGNVVALASYDVSDGSFQPARAAKFSTDRRGPRGHDLFLREDGSVAVSGQLPLYARSEDVHYIDHAELTCPLGTVTVITAGLGLLPPGEASQAKPKPVWTARPFHENAAVVLAENAVVVAGADRQFADPEATPDETYGITALDIKTGKPLWEDSLPAGPVAWGLAIDRQGRVLVALQDGRLLCLGPQI